MEIIEPTKDLSIIDLIKETLKNKRNRKILERIDGLSEKNTLILKSLGDFYVELSEYFTKPEELIEMIRFLNESSLSEIILQLPEKQRDDFTKLFNITIL